MTKFDSKSFNPLAFGTYVNKIPSVTKTELAKSGAIGGNEQAFNALSSQSGSLYARIPYFGRISSASSQNNDGSTDIASSVTSSYEQGFVTASRMDGWTERSFSKNITAGAEFMDNVASQIGQYKMEVKQGILLAMLAGIYSMNTENDDVASIGAKEFIEKHTLDITGVDDGMVQVDTLNKAIQKAGGDNKNIFKLVIMHSEVATNLENIKLLKYMTYTDSDGIERDVAMATWNGRTVLIDDNMPVSQVAVNWVYSKTTDGDIDENKEYFTRSGTSSAGYEYNSVSHADEQNIGEYYELTSASEYKNVYTTYILGEGVIVLEDIGDSNPYEMSRDASKNGGQDTLYVRQRFVCGVDGVSFEKPASITASASNMDLANGDNWSLVSDGVSVIPHKSIAVARILSNG